MVLVGYRFFVENRNFTSGAAMSGNIFFYDHKCHLHEV